MKSVFVSHVYEDAWAKRKLERWAQDGRLGDVVITGETRDVRQDGERAIRKHLSPKLTGAAAVIVLLGNDTHNHDWVKYETNHALSAHKLVVPVRIPGTTGAAPLEIRSLREVAFEPNAVDRALNG